MTITVTIGAQVREGAIRSQEFLSQSTGTSLQTCNLSDDITYLGAGTSSGDNSANLYALPEGQDGQVKWIGFGTHATATGEAAVMGVAGTTSTGVTTTTATGMLVFSTASDFMKLQYADDEWLVVHQIGATLSTGT